MRPIDELTKPCMTTSLDEILNSDVDCVVECIGGLEPAHTYVKEALNHHKNVISSNKKMLVHFLKELVQLSNDNNVSLLFSAACGGGIPWLPELNNISVTDELNSFMGVMNGTSNYILDSMYKNDVDFNVALKKAQELGYAEADPSDDIDGVDTANKTILSSVIGFNTYVDLNDVFVKGIRYYNKQDLDFVKKNNYKVVLLGKGVKNDDGSITLTVMPTFVKSGVFSNINDNYNCFESHSSNLGKLSFIGQGAGSLPTASNVVRDINLLNNPYRVNIKEIVKPNYDLNKAKYYIRNGNEITMTDLITINELKGMIKEDSFVAEVIDD